MPKGKNLITVLSEFTREAKASLQVILPKLAESINQKVALRDKDRFICIIIAFRDMLADYVGKYEFSDYVNNHSQPEFQTYPQACVTGEQRLCISNYIEQSYDDSSLIKKGKDFEQEKFDTFMKDQRERSLHGSYPILQARCTVSKNNKKYLRTFRAHPDFTKFLDTIDSTVLTAIEQAVKL